MKLGGSPADFLESIIFTTCQSGDWRSQGDSRAPAQFHTVTVFFKIHLI